MSRALDVTTSLLASTLRGWRGANAFKPAHTQPQQPLELYEFEGCPYGRLLREALTELDLDVLIRPCPRGGSRFWPLVKMLGGKSQFPFLVDPNSGTSLYESADIVDYLVDAYGGRTRTPRGLLRALAVAGGMAATATRGLHGMRARPSKAPAQPLELYSFESSRSRCWYASACARWNYTICCTTPARRAGATWVRHRPQPPVAWADRDPP